MIPNIQIPNFPFATLGDIAAAGLGYAAGFVLGLVVKGGDTKSSAEIAGVFAVGCVGIKTLGQLWLAHVGPRRERERLESLYQETSDALGQAVTTLGNRLNDDVRNAPDELQWNHRLWDKGFRSDS